MQWPLTSQPHGSFLKENNDFSLLQTPGRKIVLNCQTEETCHNISFNVTGWVSLKVCKRTYSEGRKFVLNFQAEKGERSNLDPEGQSNLPIRSTSSM
jgi:hypothetical protein